MHRTMDNEWGRGVTAWGGAREVFQGEVMLEVRVEDKGQQCKEGGGGEGMPGEETAYKGLDMRNRKAGGEMVRGRDPRGPWRGRLGMA